MSDSRAVQLCKSTLSGGIEFDVEVLAKVFGPVIDTPVSIYSIAGAFRNGKSLMLTLCLRYLRHASKGKSNQWLENIEDELEPGFPWQPGEDRCTTGVWIWNEPFYIQTAEHQKVAVFLMDTQGLFDDQTSVKDFSTVFALSTFLSSVLVYNVMQEIQDVTLQHLELCTSYAKFARRVKHTTTAKKLNPKLRERPPFQELIFLVRDWPHVDTGYGFEPGEAKLKKLLGEFSQRVNADPVGKNLESSFQQIRCFLMHQPEKNVCQRDAAASPLKLKDLGEKFLTDLDNFVHGLFTPERLVTKKINKMAVKGGQIIHYAVEYSKVFSDGKMPELSTISEANAKVAIQTILHEGLTKYRNQLEKVLESGYTIPKKLDDIHKKAKKEILKWYDAQVKLESDRLIKNRRKELKEEIDYQYREHNHRNNAEGERQKCETRKIKNLVLLKFSRKVETWSEEKLHEDDELTVALNDGASEAIEEFRAGTKQFCATLAHQSGQQLKDNLNKQKRWFKDLNIEKKKAATDKIIEMKIGVLTDVKANVEKHLQDNDCQDEVELGKKHKEYKRDAMKTYELRQEWSRCAFERIKDNLQQEIETLFNSAKLQNQENVEQKKKAMLEQAKAEHLRYINKLFDGSLFLFQITNLDKKYEELLSEILDKAQKNIEGPNNRDEVTRVINDALIAQETFVKRRNEAKKRTVRFAVHTTGFAGATGCVSVGVVAGPGVSILGMITSGVEGVHANVRRIDIE